MHPSFLRYYDEELRHLREVAGEFAREYPKAAGKLGLDEFECADPYVERLLEGFAFMAARVRLKIDDEYPQFTSELLNIVYPDYLAPTPAAAVIELQPDRQDAGLAAGHLVPRGTALRSAVPPGEQTACEFTLACDVRLYPLAIEACDYLPTTGAIAALGVRVPPGARAGLRLRIAVGAGVPARDLELDALRLFFRGAEGIGGKLHELVVREPVAVVMRDGESGDILAMLDGESSVAAAGYDDDEAMLPTAPASFDGYRLLREYFMLPERFLFATVGGLRHAVRKASGHTFEIVLLSGRAVPELEGIVTPANVSLFAAPAINLFERRTDRINVEGHEREFHVVVDRSRPLDFEVYAVKQVSGVYEGDGTEHPFTSMYQTAVALADDAATSRHYSVRRLPRMGSSAQRRKGSRSGYAGTEVFVALADASGQADLRQLALRALCTNRDLPLMLPMGRSASDFSLETGAPVESIRALVGPTRPQVAPLHGETAWRLINHLSFNYATLADSRDEDAGLPLRKLLALYADSTEPHLRRLLESVMDVKLTPVVRRIGPIQHIVAARGVEIAVTCDETGFTGSGLFLFGAVLERFLAKYATINSFTETVIKNAFGQEVSRWPARTGLRRLL